MINTFTFWEGEMPAYIKLCMDTWKVPYTVLNYKNLKEYVDVNLEQLNGFSYMLISDYIRVHLLREHGGRWIDADTIMLGSSLPDANLIGNPDDRTHSIAILKTEPHSDMYEEWAQFQESAINNKRHWSMFGNSFTDKYVKDHPEITIYPINNCWPETYMIDGDLGRYEKYLKLYFDNSYHLDDMKPTDLLMLHNSWTPKWYKELSREEVLFNTDCTLSNILREVILEDD